MKDKELYELLDAYRAPSSMAGTVMNRVHEKVYGAPFVLFFVRQIKEAAIPLTCCLVFGILVGIFSGMTTGRAEAEEFVDQLVVKESFYD